MSKSIIAEKSYQFAVDSIRYYSGLKKTGIGVIPNQFIRSATSIGANVRESRGASSPKDFLAKLAIARKEAFEAHYWLQLIQDSYHIHSEELSQLIFQAEELVKMLSKATRTMEEKLGRK